MRRLVALLVLASCQGPPEAGGPDAGPPDFDASGDRVLLARVESFPAGGVRLTVRLEDEQGAPRIDDESGNLSMRWVGDEAAQAAAVRRAPLTDPGYTLLLLMPAVDAAALADQVAEATAFIDARPDGERVALYRWGAQVAQLANYTADRAELAAVLARVAPRDPEAPLASPAAALRDAVGSVYGVEGEAPHAMRAAVIAADHLPGPPPDGGGQNAAVQWLVPNLTEAELDALGRGRVVASYDEAAANIAAFAASSFYDIGVCGAGPLGRPAEVTLSGDRGQLTLVVPQELPELAGPDCDPVPIVDVPRAYPDRIELVFTAEQRAVYDERAAGNSKADFDLSIRYGDGQTPVEASAHLRGKGSIGCARRNYTIDFKGPRPRYLMPGSATDEFYLISMCLDDRYVRAHTVYTLLAEQQLLPPRFRYIELLLDGETRGVYMLVEKPVEEIVRDNGRVRSVLRRRFDAGDDRTYAEVKYAGVADDQAIAIYDSVLTDVAGLSGEELEQALEARVDLDGYLRIMAMNSVLHNGDNVDEMWLFSTDRLAADGSVAPWFSFMGWDPDDVFHGCHYSGNLAYPDTYALSYCAEAELDDIVLGDPVLYERYATALEEMMADIDPAHFRAVLDQTGDALLEYLRRPEIAAAMVELLEDNPAASDPEVAEAEVNAALDALQTAFEQRRALLRSRLDSFWGAAAP